MTKKELQEQNTFYQEAIAQSNRALEQLSWKLYLDGQKELAYKVWHGSVAARPEVTFPEYIASLDRRLAEIESSNPITRDKTPVTVRTWINLCIFDAATRRHAKLTELRAPQVILESLTELIETAQNGEIQFKTLSEFADLRVLDSAKKTGNGGIKYYTLTTNDGEVNFFPNARYGYFMSRPKHSTLLT